MKIDLEKLKRYEPKYIGTSEVCHSVVTIPLIRRPDGGWNILFEVRSATVMQPGDVCLPGGRQEPGETWEETAMREAREELLISEEQLKLIAPTDIIVAGNIMIHTFAGILSGYDGAFDPGEVEETFQVPLEFFMENEPERYTASSKREIPEDFPFDRIYGGRSYGWKEFSDDILFYYWEDRTIWGLTAKIMFWFAKIMKEDQR